MMNRLCRSSGRSNKRWDGGGAQDAEEGASVENTRIHSCVCQTQPAMVRTGPRGCHLGHICHTGWLIKLLISFCFVTRNLSAGRNVKSDVSKGNQQ